MAKRHDVYGTTDLPVLLPAAERLNRQAAAERVLGAPKLRLRAWHGLALAAVIVLWTSFVWAQADGAGNEQQESVISAIWRWLPVLLGGFVFNIAISFLSMGIGTVAGTLLGIMQISQVWPVRGSSWLVTQFFRNAPWLVLLFFCMFLLPFEFTVFGVTIPFPDWIKAVIGLALPVMANVSEIVRGAIQSIPSGQWEAAHSLAFSRWQILSQIILPQCVKRMLPPWMNLYAILTMATVLASVVGVGEVMTLTQRVLAAENRPEFLVPFYGFVMLLFFAYCYPIARTTQKLELRYAVKQ
ncbi:polar amino acid ABC transporter permease [Rhodovibrio sodomensis]|uniref:Polar amino acid ABC transporter permease n=1 Tax=Rhodovibrio sodomensis TaxID=1088 RepID=A0ABS1DIA9_9PROT|nr:amino acid ABC transporter permease [Rhodovibrio sodomensis]MBK1669574.1 polar amino acid ABC transporter permease [Rhodovibrio sodomensis]